MTVLLLNIDRAMALHLATALELHAKTCRANGVDLPEQLGQLASRCWRIAKGDQECPDDPLRDFVDRLSQAPAMLLTYAQAAGLLAVSERTVKRLVAEGLLPLVHVAGAARIRHEDVERYVADLGSASFRDDVRTKDAPATPRPQRAAARRRSAGAGAFAAPAGAPASPAGGMT